MQPEPYSLPSQHAQPYSGPSYSPYHCNIPAPLLYDLIRLHQEKNFLSMQLADCVTYLTALRERQGKHVRQLSVETALPQKKRRKLQQTKRHLDIEIRKRERDEEACLNNLQACETNIILANMKGCQLANASFSATEMTTTPTLYTPTLCSSSGSEAVSLPWEGWTDEAAVSPFRKKAISPFVGDDVAPDACIKDLRHDSAMAKDIERPLPLYRDAEELSTSLPVPPNTAQSQFRRTSILSPEAAVFHPLNCTMSQGNGSSMSKLNPLSTSSTEGLLQNRRFSAAEILPILHRFTFHEPSSGYLPGQMWCNSTPQQHPHEVAGVPLKRERTNSL